MTIKTVEDTDLWKRLNSGFQNTDQEEIADRLATDLKAISEEACNRMKAFPSLHPQYTLHDRTHLLRVTQLMGYIIPQDTAESLNAIEITLLILSAQFHDQGMVLSQGELSDLEEDSHFKLFEQDWKEEHPNLDSVRDRLTNHNLSEDERRRCRRVENELLAALLTDYVRTGHAERSAEFVLSNYSDDPRWKAKGVGLARFVAKLCRCHTEPASYISEDNGFYPDESIGEYTINMQYLAVVLRLADILDFDRERTPDELYRSIHFTNQVSLREWKKHRSVGGWIINSEAIRFTARCKHPEYERAIRRYMDWIDRELSAAHSVVRSLPKSIHGYSLTLPLQADRGRIEPLNNAYIYHDLEFSLSRSEIVKLLMTDELYNSPSLCVRELLQNSLDALRYRKALTKRDSNAKWSAGKVELEHRIDDHGREVLTCTDNGVGMDEKIVTQFLTNAGRSYYRSSRFEEERRSFQEVGADFDPCAQFGIGFMSCFMFGDDIKIKTRRDYGPKEGLGPPLVVEISGLGGIIVIKAGDEGQEAGTRIEITGGQKPVYHSKYADDVRLIAAVDGYAIATEFPIEAICKIPEIEGTVDVPAAPSEPQTAMEAVGLQHICTFSQNFSDIDPRLGGVVKESFLVDEEGNLVLGNSEMHWELSDDDNSPSLRTASGEEVKVSRSATGGEFVGSQTCLDGILVCGEPGRSESQSFMLGSTGNKIHLSGSFMLDVRGAIKPRLTPARTPPKSRGGKGEESWERIDAMASQAEGRLWEKAADLLGDKSSQKVFWSLLVIYSIDPSWLRSQSIWRKVSVPVSNGPSMEWRKVSELGKLQAHITKWEDNKRWPEFSLELSDGGTLSTEWLAQWKRRANRKLQRTIIGMSTVVINGDEAILELRPPSIPEKAPNEFALRSRWSSVMALPYAGGEESVISAQAPYQSLNRNHPLVNLAIDTQFKKRRSKLEEFARIACFRFRETYDLSDALKNPDEPSRGLKYLAGLFHSVRWEDYSPDLRPPYGIHLQNEGKVEIGGDHFSEWLPQ